MKIIPSGRGYVTFSPFKDLQDNQKIKSSSSLNALLINLFLSIFCLKPAYIRYKDTTGTTYWLGKDSALSWVKHYKPDNPLPKTKAALFALIQRICAEQIARNNQLKVHKREIPNSNSDHLGSSFESGELSEEPEIYNDFKANSPKQVLVSDQPKATTECLFSVWNQEADREFFEAVKSLLSSFPANFSFQNLTVGELNDQKGLDKPVLLFLPFHSRPVELFQANFTYQSIAPNSFLIFLSLQDFNQERSLNELMEIFPGLEKRKVLFHRIQTAPLGYQILNQEALLANIKDLTEVYYRDKSS